MRQTIALSRISANAKPHSRAGGFALLELLLAIVLISLIAVGLMNAFTLSFVSAKDDRMLQVAQRLAELTMDAALANPFAASVSDAELDGLPGYRYDLEISGVSDSNNVNRTLLTVTVRYRFITGQRVYRLEAWRYGI